MSDEFEDARIFLELTYFTVSLSSDTMNTLQYFKSDFVVLIQPIIEKLVSQFPSPNERQILTHQSYRRLVSVYVQKIRPLIDAFKQSGLWVPQGTAPATVEAADLIASVTSSDTFDVEQLLVLRSVRTNQLIYSPELPLYFNACLLCCQSPIVIVRLYSYSLLRAAPMIMDLRQLIEVFQHAYGIWERGLVSFEFCACLFLLLQRFSEHRPSTQDESEYEQILELIARLHNSNNFEQLMCFDPTLRWMFSSFPQQMILRVSETALESLQEKHSGDFCIICKCLEMGIGDAANFSKAVTIALETVANWAHPIQKQARGLLATLPLSAPACVTPEVMNIIAEALGTQTAEPALYIFAQFLVSVFLGTSAPLHVPLLHSLLNMMAQSEGKKNLPLDIQNIIIAICSSTARFLDVLKASPDKRQMIFSALKQTDLWQNSLIAALASPTSSVMASEAQAKAAVKAIKEKPLTIEEKEGFDFYVRLNIHLPMLISMYPSELRKLVEHLTTEFDEDLKYIILEIFCIVAMQGRNQAECQELKASLPAQEYECEYTGLVKRINECLSQTPSNFDQMSSHIDSSLSQFLVIGSASNTAAALLFEYIVWAEGAEVLVMFKRLRLKPANWFAGVLASLFSSVIKNPTGPFLETIDQRAKDSAQHLVWLGYVVFRKLLPELRQCIVREEYSTLPQHLLYPQIEWELTPDDIRIMDHLEATYSEILNDLFHVMVSKS